MLDASRNVQNVLLPVMNLINGGRFVTDTVVSVARVVAIGTMCYRLSSLWTLWSLVLWLTTFMSTNSAVPNSVRVVIRSIVVLRVVDALILINVITTFSRSMAEHVRTVPKLPRCNVRQVLNIAAVSLMFTRSRR